MTQESPDQQPPKRFDASDAEAVGERKRDVNARDARKKVALQRLLSDPAGREWVWDLLKDCYMFSNTFTGNSEGFFREGKRNIGLQILADINRASPDVFATMMKENYKP